MSEAPRVLLAGGYGVFGRLLARELLDTTSAHLVLAGRSAGRAEHARRALGSADRTEALALDLSDADAVERAATGCVAIACTAGPFQQLPKGLAAAVVRAGAHWLDVADDPGWVLGILDDEDLHITARARGVSVMPGLSTVPAVSGALARWCRARRPDADRADVTLFIGNRNAKGPAATASALVTGFSGHARSVELPFGRKRAYAFATPDTVLLRRDLGIDAEFRVALEWAWLSWLTAMIGRVTRGRGPGSQARIASVLSRISRPISLLGTFLGCVQVELLAEGAAGRDDADRLTAAAIAGQRLVILPCALALAALLDGALSERGVLHPAGWLPVDAFIEALRSRGVQLLTRTGAARRSTT
jgi:hypothetical protein